MRMSFQNPTKQVLNNDIYIKSFACIACKYCVNVRYRFKLIHVVWYITGCARTEGYYKLTNKDKTWLSNPQETEKPEPPETVRVSSMQ